MKTNSRRSLEISRWMTLRFGVLILSMLAAMFAANPASAQDNRKVKVSVDPTYPDLARRNNIRGVVRVQVVIAPDGNVKDVRVLGGSPVLAQAAVDAVKKRKYEPAANETTTILKFEFAP